MGVKKKRVGPRSKGVRDSSSRVDACTQGLGNSPSAVRIQARQSGLGQLRHFVLESGAVMQVIGVTLFATPGTNRGGIGVSNPTTRLALYDTIMETNGKGTDDGVAINIDTAQAYIGPGSTFRNNTSNSGNGGAVFASGAARVTIADGVSFISNKATSGGAVRACIDDLRG